MIENIPQSEEFQARVVVLEDGSYAVEWYLFGPNGEPAQHKPHDEVMRNIKTETASKRIQWVADQVLAAFVAGFHHASQSYMGFDPTAKPKSLPAPETEQSVPSSPKGTE